MHLVSQLAAAGVASSMERTLRALLRTSKRSAAKCQGCRSGSVPQGAWGACPVQCAAVSTGVMRVAHVPPQGCHNLGASPGILPARLSVARCGAGCAGAACKRLVCPHTGSPPPWTHPTLPMPLSPPPAPAELPGLRIQNPSLLHQDSISCTFQNTSCSSHQTFKHH